MILVGVHFFEDDVGMVLRPRLEEFLEVALNPFVEDLASVFGRPYKMIVTHENTMAHSSIHAHAMKYTNPEAIRTWLQG